MSREILIVGNKIDHGTKELLRLLKEVKLMTVEEYNVLYEETQKDIKELEQLTSCKIVLTEPPEQVVLPPKTKYKKNRRFWE